MIAILGRAFALDLRSLAVFRVALGLLVAADVGIALTNVIPFYSDEGVLPRQVLMERLWEGPAQWSLHALNGAPGFQVALLLIQLLAAIGLVAGWRTRIMTLVCWALACSLESRNPLISNGADSVLRLLLFWSLFLPLGEWWSADSRRKPVSRQQDQRLISLPATCLVLQLGFIYVFSAVMKDHRAWFVEGTALQTALHLDLFATPLGVWLREQTALCQGLTLGTAWLELLGPWLLLTPIWRGRTRLLLCLLFAGFHLGIALCMNIGAFPWVMMVAWLAMIPGGFWDRILRSSSPVAGTVPPSQSQAPWMVRMSVRGGCSVCLIYIFLWNLRGTDFARWESWFPRASNPLAFVLRLDQHWSMFAPLPTREDGWFVLRAGLSDGTEVDLLRAGQPTDWAKPAHLSASFKDARWQKYLMNLWLQRYREFRPAFGEYMAREWNAGHGGLSQVVAWQFYFVLEPTLDGGSTGPVQRVLLAEGAR